MSHMRHFVHISSFHERVSLKHSPSNVLSHSVLVACVIWPHFFFQESAAPGSLSSSSSSCSSDESCTRCSSIRLAWTLWIRLKKSSSGTVGARGPPSGGEQRWSSILDDWTNAQRNSQFTRKCFYLTQTDMSYLSSSAGEQLTSSSDATNLTWFTT